MLEVVQNVISRGKVYHWAEHLEKNHQKHLHEMPRIWDTHRKSITPNMDHHDPSFISRGHILHCAKRASYVELQIIFPK